MTRPIAKPAHVPSRPRRRQGSSPLFRTALVFALVVTCVVLTPFVLVALGAIKPPPAGQSRLDSGEPVVAGLAPGACLSFAPSDGHFTRSVFVDPGHGGLDPGVVGMAGGRQVLEKDVALSVATGVGELLRGDGYRVVLSRTTDSSVAKLTDADSVTGALTASAVHRDLVARIACANASSASVLVSIHFDAFDDPTVGGAETFYDAARSFAGATKELASSLQAALVARLGVSDRGAWTDDGVGTAVSSEGTLYNHLVLLGPSASGWVDHPTVMPGALVEPLFLTNPNEARLAAGPAGQQRIAEALRNGVEKFLAGG